MKETGPSIILDAKIIQVDTDDRTRSKIRLVLATTPEYVDDRLSEIAQPTAFVTLSSDEGRRLYEALRLLYTEGTIVEQPEGRRH